MLKEAIYIATGKQFGTVPYPESVAAARALASEGMVLLRNDGALPLQCSRLALFGRGAWDTIVCGTGSGYAFSPYRVTVAEGLKGAGLTIVNEAWGKQYLKARKRAEKEQKLSFISKRWSGITPDTPEQPVTAADLAAAKAAGAATAIYCLQRNTGEGSDRKAVKGDYYLADAEVENLTRIAAAFPGTVVLLNTCVIDMTELDSIPGIGAVLLIGQAGMETGNAAADILCGKVNPSGHLTGSWARRYEDYPASATFSMNDNDTSEEIYSEGIYMGYRWFDSFGLEVQYPFGYGLSYTTFKRECTGITADGETVTASFRVTNTGSVAGKDVLQLYVSAPAGRLDKPYQELRAFRKTSLLAPGSSELLTLSFATEALASFDEEKSAWVMEPGEYLLRAGANSRETGLVGVITLDAGAVTRTVTNVLHPVRDLQLVRPAPGTKPVFTSAEAATVFRAALSAASIPTVDNTSRVPKLCPTYIPEGSSYTLPVRRDNNPFPLTEQLVTVSARPDAILPDVKAGKVSLEEFVASLDAGTLIRIVAGVGAATPHPVPARKPGLKKNKVAVAASGKTTDQYEQTLGIPQMALCDGPAGLHLMGSNCTAFPVGMVAAQSWNPGLSAAGADTYAKELEKYGVNIALGPGMNLYRDPLCGRCFEYYSEDPLVTGLTAAAFTRGLQEKHPRCGVSLKHFCCNNQEIDRITSDSNVSVRALRELYLKGFEICVRTAAPRTIMTSYNCLNGIHTSSRYDLLTDVLRGEWGFTGLIMTDWDGQSTRPYDLHAGNSLLMGGYNPDKLMAAYTGKAPEFGEDGAVKQQIVKAYGGFFKNTVTEWNSFEPCAGGPDTVSTVVKAGTALSERVQQGIDQGIAVKEELPGGDIRVTWKGLDRGQWLALGDLQKCAMDVLRSIMDIML